MEANSYPGYTVLPTVAICFHENKYEYNLIPRIYLLYYTSSIPDIEHFSINTASFGQSLTYQVIPQPAVIIYIYIYIQG